MEGGGAGGTRTPDPLHAMQVLSQLSYNPTDSVGPLVGAVSVATRPGLSPDCSTGEFHAPRFTGFHHPGSLVNEAWRVLLPRHRIDFEDSTGVRSPSICRTLDTMCILTI